MVSYRDLLTEACDLTAQCVEAAAKGRLTLLEGRLQELRVNYLNRICGAWAAERADYLEGNPAAVASHDAFDQAMDVVHRLDAGRVLDDPGRAPDDPGPLHALAQAADALRRALEPPPRPILCSIPELIRAMGRHVSNRDFLKRRIAVGDLVVVKAAVPQGHWKNEATFRDRSEHEDVRAEIEDARRKGRPPA